MGCDIRTAVRTMKPELFPRLAPAGSLRVCLHSARDLFKPTPGHEGFVSAFAVISFQGSRRSTHVVPRANSPCWNSVFDFDVHDNALVESHTLILHIFDQIPLSSRRLFLGKVLLNLECLVQRKTSRKSTCWYPLVTRAVNKKSTGDVCLSITYSPVALDALTDKRSLPHQISKFRGHSDWPAAGYCERQVDVASEHGGVNVEFTQSNGRDGVCYATGECALCKDATCALRGQLHLLPCSHRCCISCISLHAQQAMADRDFARLICPVPGCGMDVPERILRKVLCEEDLEAILEYGLQRMVDRDSRFVRCPGTGCRILIERVVAAQEGEEDGAQQAQRAHRMRCRECHTSFCANCMTVPFHMEMTCEQHYSIAQHLRCRVCRELLPGRDQPCRSPSCMDRYVESCDEPLPCEHECVGLRGDACLPCLEKGCELNTTPYSGEDFCNICWHDTLRSSPCIQLRCGHIFHYTCVLNQLRMRWPTKDITFNFLNCVVCKDGLAHPRLAPVLLPHRSLLDRVRAAAEAYRVEKRLQYTVEEVGRLYSFYQCDKCEGVYCGGRKQCMNEWEEGLDDPNAKRLCTECKCGRCPVHGTRALVHKCKYCCNQAEYYCWGTTHFCGRLTTFGFFFFFLVKCHPTRIF